MTTGLESDLLEPEVDPEDLPRDELVPIARSLDVTFDATASTLQIATLATGIDTTRWVSGNLIVLFHSASNWSFTGLLKVTVELIQLDLVDPATVFQNFATTYELTFSPNIDGVPSMKLLELGPLASMLQVRLLWDQGVREEVDQRATISIYLQGRFHAPREVLEE